MPPKSKLTLQKKGKSRSKQSVHLPTEKTVVEQVTCQVLPEANKFCSHETSSSLMDVTQKEPPIGTVNAGESELHNDLELPTRCTSGSDQDGNASHECILCGMKSLTSQDNLIHLRHCCDRLGMEPSELVLLTKQTNPHELSPDKTDFKCDKRPLRAPQHTELHPLTQGMRKRKVLKKEALTESEMEDIQLAIALSASETHGGTGAIELEKERPKRRKQGARTHHPPPLASLTSSQVQQNIESRLGCILEENGSSGSGGAHHTPDLPISKLSGSHYERNKLVLDTTPRCLFDTATGRDNEVGKNPPVAIVSEQSSVLCTSTLPASEGGLWELAAYGEKAAYDLFYVQSLTSLMASNKKESTKSVNDQLSLIEVEELEKAKKVELHQSPVHKGKYNCSDVKSVGVQTEEVITQTELLTQLQNDFGSVLGTSLLADTEVLLGDGTHLSAHAIILAARWPLFRDVISQQILIHGTYSLDLSQHDPQMMRSLMRYLYTGNAAADINEVNMFLDTTTSLKVSVSNSNYTNIRSKDGEDMREEMAVSLYEQRSYIGNYSDVIIDTEPRGTEEHHGELCTSTSLFSPVCSVDVSKDYQCTMGNDRKQNSPQIIPQTSSLNSDERVIPENVAGINETTDSGGGRDDISCDDDDTSSITSSTSCDSDIGSVDDDEGCAAHLFDLDCPQVELLVSPVQFLSNCKAGGTSTPMMTPLSAGISIAPISVQAVESETGNDFKTSAPVANLHNNQTFHSSTTVSLHSIRDIGTPPPTPLHAAPPPTNAAVTSSSPTTPSATCSLPSAPGATSSIRTSPCATGSLPSAPGATSSIRTSPCATGSLPKNSDVLSPSSILTNPIDIVSSSIHVNVSSFPTSTVVATPVLNPPGVPLTPAGFISGPVTPMPNYTEMATPWLKSQLLKFGVRPLPKKKTIAKLIEIYEYLHPVVNECVKVSESGEPPVAAVQVEDHERKSKSTKSRKNQQLKPNIEPCVCQDLWTIVDNLITYSMFERMLKGPVWRFYVPQPLDETEKDSEDIERRVHLYIQEHKDVHLDIVTYKTLDFAEFHMKLKEDGINVSKPKLMDLLDRQNITFSLPRTASRRKCSHVN